MSAAKSVLLYGLTGRVEAGYGAGGALSLVTDGILLAEPSEMPTPTCVHDGARGAAPGSGANRRRGRQSGRSGAFSAKIEARGLGSNYSVSGTPPDIHTLMRVSGHSATVDEVALTYTYRPITAGFASGVFDGYARGQRFPITGAYADMSWAIDGPGFLVMSFDIQGLVGLPVDAGVPAITYRDTIPPKCEGINLTIGAWSPVVRKVAFKAGRKISPRADVNSAGHRGFSLVGREPEITLTVEAGALATFDPYTAREQATVYGFGFTAGSVQFNKVRFSAPYCQITSVTDGDDDGTATWDLTLTPSGSTPGANDDYLMEWS